MGGVDLIRVLNLVIENGPRRPTETKRAVRRRRRWQSGDWTAERGELSGRWPMAGGQEIQNGRHRPSSRKSITHTHWPPPQRHQSAGLSCGPNRCSISSAAHTSMRSRKFECDRESRSPSSPSGRHQTRRCFYLSRVFACKRQSSFHGSTGIDPATEFRQ